ncbi:MAG: hypothetical protein KCHDKBKB_00999 [Elusimicrobia bacterium]|nr:hypothetical protein [Elusimicrobiota bacterium]
MSRFGGPFRRWYAKHFYDILDNIFMFTVGMMFILAICAIAEVCGF